MRVGIAYLIQETNSFSPIPTKLEDFRISTGRCALERWKGTKTEFGAFIDFLSDSRIEVVPLLAGWAITQGPIEADEFSRLKAQFATELEQVGRLDGLLLALHGRCVLKERMTVKERFSN